MHFSALPALTLLSLTSASLIPGSTGPFALSVSSPNYPDIDGAFLSLDPSTQPSAHSDSSSLPSIGIFPNTPAYRIKTVANAEGEMPAYYLQSASSEGGWATLTGSKGSLLLRELAANALDTEKPEPSQESDNMKTRGFKLDELMQLSYAGLESAKWKATPGADGVWSIGLYEDSGDRFGIQTTQIVSLKLVEILR